MSSEPAPDPSGSAGTAQAGTTHRRAAELGRLAELASEELAGAHRAREQGLAGARRVVQAASRAIRAVHRGESDVYAARIEEATAALRETQAALQPFPAVAHAGFLHDAEKEYAEARLTRALTTDAGLPDARTLGVGIAAWLGGLAEAASELRRELLDRMRADEVALAIELLESMEDVYDILVTVDFPDALTGHLRRSTDALRAVTERSRADVTTTLVQLRLRHALEAARPGAARPPGPEPDGTEKGLSRPR